MSVDTSTLVAAIAGAAAAGGGVRWAVDRVITIRRDAAAEPLQALDYTAKAAQAIAEASASLILPLQQQLARNFESARLNSDKIAALEAVVAAIRVSEHECRSRLAALEAQAAGA